MVEKNPVKRLAFLVLGILFLGLALVGIVVPGLPTTINAIIAGFFFARSSERFDEWLTSHRVLGPIVLDHRSGVGFTMRAKTIAVTAISLSIVLSSWLISRSSAPSFVLLVLAAAWIYAVWYVLHQPTKQVVAS